MSSLKANVLRKDAASQKILEYVPEKINLGVSNVALEFDHIQTTRRNDFKMSEVLKVQTGLKQKEIAATEEKVEQMTLEKLKSIQEEAYKQAYELGLDDGKKEAFEKADIEITRNLKMLGGLIDVIASLKSELLKQNEAHLLKLVLHIANRLAKHEVTVNNQCIVNIMREAVETAQMDEDVQIQVSPDQFNFLDKLKQDTGRDFDFLKKVKLVPVENISKGGCIIESNYGVIDSRIEERINKLFEAFSENLYRVKDKIGAA